VPFGALESASRLFPSAMSWYPSGPGTRVRTCSRLANPLTTRNYTLIALLVRSKAGMVVKISDRCPQTFSPAEVMTDTHGEPRA